MNHPGRGEVWLVDLGLAAKVRPAVILSEPPGEKDRALIALISHTTSLRGSAFEVPIRLHFLKPGAFDVQSIVTIPRAKLIRRLGQLNQDQMASIESALLRWLGLARPGNSSEKSQQES